MSRLLIRLCRVPVIAAISAIAALTAVTFSVGAKERVQSPEETAQRDAGEPIMAIVSIKSQRVTFYDADGWIFSAPVSTGIKGRETPAGVFAVIEKDLDHHSTLYDDASMPHMQRLTWNGIALHGGPLPGYAASHGCVRMPYGFAENLFDKTQIGMRVIISPDDAAPVEFSHAALLVPNAEAVAAAPERAEMLDREAAETTKIASEAKKSAAKAARDAASSKASLRKLEGLKSGADANLAHAEKAIATAKTDEAKARAEEQKLKAATKATDAGTKLETAKADATSKIDAAAKAADAAKEAATRKTDTAKAANDAKLALEPVSIYISRATQKLYVRRNTHKAWPDGGEVFDASIEVPVVIRDPDRPIGTHVFTAAPTRVLPRSDRQRSASRRHDVRAISKGALSNRGAVKSAADEYRTGKFGIFCFVATRPRLALSSGPMVAKPMAVEMISQGSTILPVSLPPPRVSVRLSIVYVPPPVAPWYLPVPPVVL